MTWTIDKSHSSVEFSVRHMMVSSVKGRFTDYEVEAKIDPDNLEESHATVRIKPESIDTRDEQRDGHLRSDDFFGAEQYPEIVFQSREIDLDGKNGDVRITGDLTVRDVTRPITLKGEVVGPLKDPWGNDRVGLSVEGQLNRKEYGLNWNTALEAGGVLVGDKVKLSIDAEFVKQAA
jgi:polyisoprenoid-binding protein YceI